MKTFITFRKLIGNFLLPFFIYSSVLPIQPLRLAFAQSTPDSPARAVNITVPAEFGKVEEVYWPDGLKEAVLHPTILIQDAHINFDAQMSEAKLFDYFTKEKTYKTILLEGVFESLDTRVLKNFPDARKKEELSKRWLRKGILKGGEYFDINLNDQSIEFVGLEDPKLYFENHKAFLKLIESQTKAFKSQFKKLLSKLKNLENRLYSESLSAFNKLQTRYHRGQLQLLDYLIRLKQYPIDWKTFPQMDAILKAQSSKDTNAREELQNLNANQLFKELDALEIALVDQLASSDKEKKLYELSRNIELLEKGLQFELSRLEKELLEEALASLQSQSLADRFQELGSRIKISPYIQWNETLNLILQYYEAAEKREVEFRKKILDKPKSLVLIGGYHTQGLTEFLREQQKPFLVISPKIERLDSKGDREIYLKQVLAMKPRDTFITRWAFESSEPFAAKRKVGMQALKEMGVDPAKAETYMAASLGERPGPTDTEVALAFQAQFSDTYRVLMPIQWLGQGAFGKVFKAHHIGMGLDVAIKFQSIKEEAYKRFGSYRDKITKEVEAHGQLNHPTIIRLLDRNRFKIDPYYYYEYEGMDLVEGSTLSVRLRDAEEAGKKLSGSLMLKIVARIAQAIGHMASHDVVHRDIKPANIMISREEEVKLVDLGTAIRAGETDAEEFVKGTPAYMSVEQASNKPIDTRADLYSLGVVLYEMLMGDVPYKGETYQQIFKENRDKNREPMVDVDPPLAGIVSKLLEPVLKDRYRSAKALVDDLDKYTKKEALSFHESIFDDLSELGQKENWKKIVSIFLKIIPLVNKQDKRTRFNRGPRPAPGRNFKLSNLHLDITNLVGMTSLVEVTNLDEIILYLDSVNADHDSYLDFP